MSDNFNRKIVCAGDKNYSLFHFSWTLTNWCNYSCTYCSAKPVMVDKWKKDENISKYKLTLEKLKRFDAPFHIQLYGGEPSLHPNIKDILLGLKQIDNCKQISIITNLSKSLNFWKDIMMPGVDVCASFHPEYYDDQFISKIKFLNNLKDCYIRVTVNLIDKKEYWPMTLEFIEQLKKNNIDHNLHYLYNTPFWKSNYTEEFFKTFGSIENHTYKGKNILFHTYKFDDGSTLQYKDLEIYNLGYHKFKGFKCRPLFYQIHFNGDIVNSCTKRPIKNLLLTKDLLDVTEICPCDSCACEVMFNFYKERV